MARQCCQVQHVRAPSPACRKHAKDQRRKPSEGLVHRQQLCVNEGDISTIPPWFHVVFLPLRQEMSRLPIGPRARPTALSTPSRSFGLSIAMMSVQGARLEFCRISRDRSSDRAASVRPIGSAFHAAPPPSHQVSQRGLKLGYSPTHEAVSSQRFARARSDAEARDVHRGG